LAIIAYRQPIGRIEMEYIRGVSSAGVIRTLQDRALVDVVARGEGLGRPLLYGTTQRFLEHFGFRSLEDLPRPEELPVILSERAPLEEEAPPEETSELAPEDEPAESEPGVEEVLAEPESGTPDSGPNGGGHVAGEPEEIQDPEDTDRD
jgi:segregation and condensation protein B